MSGKSVLYVAAISLVTTVAFQHYQAKGGGGITRKLRVGA